MSDPSTLPPPSPTQPVVLLTVLLGALGLALAGGAYLVLSQRHAASELPSATDSNAEDVVENPFDFEPSDSDGPPAPRMNKHGDLTLHWEPLPDAMASRLAPTSAVSNIHPEDYVGPESCKKCHAKNHENWSRHPHRFMNAVAGPDTVKGDFTGEQDIVYQGASGSFYIDGGQYWMKIQRDGVTHIYQIAKTLGSRFFQYYIGRGVEGPPPEGHEDYYAQEQVLPFGYWIDRKMWVPIVHVADELPDEGGRWNPLDPPFSVNGHKADLVYAERCSVCHTTYPLGDSIIRHPEFRGQHLPNELHLGVSEYTARSHPEFWSGKQDPRSVSNQQMYAIVGRYSELQTPDQAATLGISCEACHLGARAHAEGRLKKPSFAAQSQTLRTGVEVPLETGPVKENVNWACSRCHVGHRPQYAAGASTWNSVEYSDAMRGGCYSQLTCIDCHEPHTATGRRWSKPPEVDDATCLKCHDAYRDAAARQSHTHHSAGSTGDRCMNCHMPRINEGLQDAVRTHMIYSPTQAEMVEAGHPNACNLCHLDKNIDWTLDHLSTWYGASYDESKIEEAYSDRSQAMGPYWLAHPHEGTRLVTVDALAKAKAEWALPDMLKLLDDKFLLNRQFAQKGIEDMLEVELAEWGYVFYMTRKERRQPIAELTKALLAAREN